MRFLELFCLSLCASSVCACAEVTQEDPPSNPGAGAPPASTLPVLPGPSRAPVGPAPAQPASTPRPGSGEAPPAARPPSTPPSTPSTTPPSTLPPAAPTGPAGELLFSDNFEDGNDMGWIADAADGDDLVGEWSVAPAEQGFVYAQSDDSFDDESWAVGGDVTWTDVSVETRFRFTAVNDMEDATVMLAARFRSKDDYYWLEYRGDGSVKIRTSIDGSDSEAASEDAEQVPVVGQWINLRLVVQGTQLTAFVDGDQIGQGTADELIASGGIALGVKENAAVEFDDVTVTRP